MSGARAKRGRSRARGPIACGEEARRLEEEHAAECEAQRGL